MFDAKPGRVNDRQRRIANIAKTPTRGSAANNKRVRQAASPQNNNGDVGQTSLPETHPIKAIAIKTKGNPTNPAAAATRRRNNRHGPSQKANR
jgi:hypothetical protein